VFPVKFNDELVKFTKFIPTLSDFGFDEKEINDIGDERTCYHFTGGERYGLTRLNEYVHQKKSVAIYAQTRNEVIGTENTAKLSPWLANGSISIRRIFHSVKHFEKEFGENDSTKAFKR
jgi:deoxyribodipyrimidine photo-lyase